MLVNTNNDLIIICCFVCSHSTGSTQWVDPRLAQVKKATVDECDEDGKIILSLISSNHFTTKGTQTQNWKNRELYLPKAQ